MRNIEGTGKQDVQSLESITAERPAVRQAISQLPIPPNMHPSHDRQTSSLNMVELESKRRLSAQLQDGLPFKNCTGSNVP
jgi:hypothetical protein